MAVQPRYSFKPYTTYKASTSTSSSRSNPKYANNLLVRLADLKSILEGTNNLAFNPYNAHQLTPCSFKFYCSTYY